MGDEDPPAAVLKDERGLVNEAERFERGGQAGLLSIAIAEDGLHRTAQRGQLPGSEGSNEIPGMDNQVAARVPEQADGSPQIGDVVVRIRENADHRGKLYPNAARLTISIKPILFPTGVLPCEDGRDSNRQLSHIY